VLCAATIPTHGTKSIMNYIKQEYPRAVEISNAYLHQHHPRIKQTFVEVFLFDVFLRLFYHLHNNFFE
jgi:hypothetical protein